MSPSVHDVQRRFLQAVVSSGPDESGDLSDSPQLSAQDGLAIYANAYLARLVGCLSESFPAVAKTVGDEAFAALAVDYLGAYPPRGPNLASLGEHFAAHLEATRPEDAGDWAACLADLARLERAIEEVFDGPGSEGEDAGFAAQLATLGPDDWSRARLVPNPALRLLSFAFPVDGYWSAVRGLDQELPQLPQLPVRAAESMALNRREFVVRRLLLDGEEAQLLERLVAGDPVGVAIAGCAAAASEAQLQGWFARWVREGVFVGLECC